MKKIIALTLISLFTSAYAAVDHQKCPVDASDPFSTEIRMPGGPYKGRCINSAHYRSVRSLNAKELHAFGLTKTGKTLQIANFRHLEKFWVAEIPLASIDRVIFQKMDLVKTGPVYHGQLRFVMKDHGKAVILIPQKRDPSKRIPLELREHSGKPQDFVVALFGVRDLAHDKDKYNPLLGLGLIGQSKYAMSYAFQSLYDGAQWALDSQQAVSQYELKLKPSDRLQILNRAVNLGDTEGIGEMYDVLTNNCLNFVFRLLNFAVTNSPNLHLTLRTMETLHPENALRILGLINFTAEKTILSDEFRDGIDKIEP